VYRSAIASGVNGPSCGIPVGHRAEPIASIARTASPACEKRQLPPASALTLLASALIDNSARWTLRRVPRRHVRRRSVALTSLGSHITAADRISPEQGNYCV
jgi:hypothetical protein